MRAGTVAGEAEDHRRRRNADERPVIAHIGPEPRSLRFPFARHDFRRLGSVLDNDAVRPIAGARSRWLDHEPLTRQMLGKGF